jgi:hypothetical protein
LTTKEPAKPQGAVEHEPERSAAPAAPGKKSNTLDDLFNDTK